MMFRELVRKKQQIPEEECIQILKEEKRGIPGRVRGGEEVPDHAEYERKTNADGKRDGHSRDVDRGDKQNIGDIKDDAAGKSPA